MREDADFKNRGGLADVPSWGSRDESLDNGSDQAYENQDLKTLDTVLDEGFVHVDSEGRLLTKPELLAYVQAVDSLQYIVEAMVVKLHGDTAVVTGLYRMKGVSPSGN